MLVEDVIAYSLRVAGVLGVGQVALAQDTADAQTALEAMLRQWQRKRWLVFRLTELWIAAAPGQPTYTIGPGTGADVFFNVRPGSMENAFLRQLTGTSSQSFPVDYPLRQITSREEWSSIPLKSLMSWPGSYFYDPTLPDGTFYIYPIPIQSFFELHFFVGADIVQPWITTDMDDYLPPETQEAVIYNLAERLQLNYQLPSNPALAARARAALNTMRTTNWAMRPLLMPAALRRNPRLRNPMGGFYPETSVGMPYTVLH